MSEFSLPLNGDCFFGFATSFYPINPTIIVFELLRSNSIKLLTFDIQSIPGKIKTVDKYFKTYPHLIPNRSSFPPFCLYQTN